MKNTGLSRRYKFLDIMSGVKGFSWITSYCYMQTAHPHSATLAMCAGVK